MVERRSSRLDVQAVTVVERSLLGTVVAGVFDAGVFDAANPQRHGAEPLNVAVWISRSRLRLYSGCGPLL
jgi:hypothetical protein